MSLKPLTGFKINLKQFLAIHGLPEPPNQVEPPTKKQRKSARSSTHQMQVITHRKGPFNNSEDNEQYFDILDTLEIVIWDNNSNSNNKSKSSLASLDIMPASILELIAEYATGKIYDCWCDKKSEILVMGDDSIHSRNNECSPTICNNNTCHNVLFGCDENQIYDIKCRECEELCCWECIGECVHGHPCCGYCLVSCAGDDCRADGAPSVCLTDNDDYIQDGNCDNCGIEKCGGCKEYYCGQCATFAECYQCKNDFCNQCHPDWFCKNEECDDYACINCNKDRISMCEICEETYCKTCIKTCKNCDTHVCQQCDEINDDICNSCNDK